MCDCLSYDDGSRYRCVVCEDEAQEAIEAVHHIRKAIEIVGVKQDQSPVTNPTSTTGRPQNGE